MVTNNGSAEILEFDDARARLRGEHADASQFASVGEFLKAVREEAGQSLEAVSERTHIKVEYLDAIETLTLDNLPSKPFAIGFVKGYAEALGLDAAPVVERFKEDAGFSSAPGVAAHEAALAPPSAGVSDERPEMSLLAVFAVIVFILWCGWQITRPKEISAPLNLTGFPAAAELHSGSAIMDPALAAQRPSAFEGEAPELPAVVEARIIDRVEPVYPPRCESGAQPQETVTVSFTITARGGISSERIAQTSNDCFDRAALNAVRRWRFVPRTIDSVRRPAFEQQFTFRFERPS